MSEQHFGRCALCGKKTELTFEHIPPRSAFNSTPARPVSGDALIGTFSEEKRMPWDIDGLPYSNQQRGMGRFSLCRQCNNDTGTWYGNDYVDFARGVSHVMLKNNVQQGQMLRIVFKEVYPLRIVKQMLSMICSINQPAMEDTRLSKLADFVLDKDAINLDKGNYKICLYLKTGALMKYCNFSVVVMKSKDGSGIEIIPLSEICAYPFGFIVYFDLPDGSDYKGCDITSFSDLQYNQKCDLEMALPIYETNNVFPLDYRTKGEIISFIEENRKWKKEHGI